MKLNYDCFRDVLLMLEENLDFIQEYPDDPFSLSFSMLEPCALYNLGRLIKYSEKDIFYTIHNLDQAGFILANAYNAGDGVTGFSISDITYEGHMFLKNIKNDTVWNKVKASAAKIGDLSLPVLSGLALAYVKELVGLS